ncbi:hypothetical protein WA158_002275 [Blastocystis sp. Blastoise]
MVANKKDDAESELITPSQVCLYYTESSQTIGVAINTPNYDLNDSNSKRFVIKMTEICETNHFSNFESILIQSNAGACYFSGRSDTGKGKIIASLLERLNIEAKHIAPKHFDTKNIDQDLCTLLGEESLMLYHNLVQNQNAMKAVAGLISSLGLLNDSDIIGSYTLKSYDISLYMRLDKPAIQTMNLFPENIKANRFSSIYGLLDCTVTNGMGKRTLERWLRHPLCDQDEINKRLDLVEFFVEHEDIRNSIRNEGLKGMVDIDKFCRKLEKRKNCQLQDLYHLLQAIKKVDLIISSLSSYEGPLQTTLKDRYITPLSQIRESLEGYNLLMQETLDTEGLDHTPPEFLIKSSWSPELREVMNCRNEIHNQIAQLYETDLHSWGSSIDLKCEVNRQYGYIYRCNAKHENILRKYDTITLLSVLKSGIIFTTEGTGGLRDLSESFSDYKKQYSQLQEILVKKAVEVASTYVAPFYLLSSYISQIDILSSFAYLSISSALPYTRPILTGLDGDNIIIKNGRHPLLEVQDGVSFIPNNYTFNRKTNRFIVITGPNMGGKSTYIRELGIISILAQIGCFVPCESAELCIFTSIYARVGAGDIQLKGVSTFMSEMIEASTILQDANEHTLVMIDELGRGTSTYDGLGLSWSIAEYIVTHIQCFCLFATHFQELIKLESLPGVSNLHVTAITNDNSITMLYEVKEGGCDQSFGIHCAELAHFPQSIIEDAKRKVQVFEKDTISAKRMKYSECDTPQQQLDELFQELLLLPSDESENSKQRYNSIMTKISELIQ